MVVAVICCATVALGVKFCGLLRTTVVFCSGFCFEVITKYGDFWRFLAMFVYCSFSSCEGTTSASVTFMLACIS